jgi:prepilin-type N-terminal cleavage/methylation domain-containing protein
MKNENGFSLIELLIVVAIIAIIAAIAVPSLLTSRMAANEAAAIQGCRTAGSAEIAYASTNNQQFAPIQTLIDTNFLDNRFQDGIDGYLYTDGDVPVADGDAFGSAADDASNFGLTATPNAGMGRFIFGIGTDQVVRYVAVAETAPEGTALPTGMIEGSGIGSMAAAVAP